MTRFVYRTLLMLLVIQAHQAFAGTQTVTVHVGGKAVQAPAATGFHEISQLSPTTRKLAETMTPPSNRLLAVFVSENDLGHIMKGETPAFHRYMLLQVTRREENSDISGPQFAQLVELLKQQQNSLLEKAKDKSNSLLAGVGETISKDYGISMKLKIGQQIPVGIFMDKPDAIGFATLGRYRVSGNGAQLDYVMANGIALLRVKGKVLCAYVYSKYETSKDLEWVRASTTSWADRMLAANSEKTSLPVLDYSADDTRFRRLQLDQGISIEIPSHWKILPREARQNLAIATGAMVNAAGIEVPSGKKTNLLAVNATPNPTGAMIRVSVTRPAEYTQADLAAARSADLRDLSALMLDQSRKLEAAGGPHVTSVQPFHIEKIRNQFALVIPYARAGATGASSWQVTQYKIPMSDRLIEITLSYRQSDSIVWRPILEHVKRSVKFQ